MFKCCCFMQSTDGEACRRHQTKRSVCYLSENARSFHETRRMCQELYLKEEGKSRTGHLDYPLLYRLQVVFNGGLRYEAGQ